MFSSVLEIQSLKQEIQEMKICVNVSSNNSFQLRFALEL